MLQVLFLEYVFLVYYFTGAGAGHVQSLILVAILTLLGVQLIVAGLQARYYCCENRKILEDIQYRVRKEDYYSSEVMNKGNK